MHIVTCSDTIMWKNTKKMSGIKYHSEDQSLYKHFSVQHAKKYAAHQKNEVYKLQ